MAKSGRTVSKRTVNHELGWAKRLFNWGADEEQSLVVCNPFARTKRIKLRKGRETWITEEDAQRLLNAPAPAAPKARTMLHAFFLLMIDTGLRFNEARKLRRDRIRERPDGRIMVDVGRTKNGKHHLVGLTKRAFEALAELEPVERGDQVFMHLRRKHGAGKDAPPVAMLISERQLRRWFREMCVATGIDSKVADGDVRLKPHDIRHSAATLAHRRGASIKAVSRMLNHSDISTTMRYIHDDEDEAAAIVDIMEAGIALATTKREPGRRRAPHRAAPPHMEPPVQRGSDFRSRM
jgi:integrase